MAIRTPAWAKPARRNSGYAVFEISAVGRVERVKNGCSVCIKGRQSEGSVKVNLVVLHRCGEASCVSKALPQYAVVFFDVEHSRLKGNVMETSG